MLLFATMRIIGCNRSLEQTIHKCLAAAAFATSWLLMPCTEVLKDALRAMIGATRIAVTTAVAHDGICAKINTAHAFEPRLVTNRDFHLLLYPSDALRVDKPFSA